MVSQKSFFIAGLLISFIFIVRFVLFFMTTSVSIIELINWGSLAYMTFAISHLYPQFKHKDERIDAIRQKGMYYSIFIVLVMLIVLMLMIQLNLLALSSLEIVRVLISVIIVSIWTNWIILSKRM
ncbi:hypothetical protein [Bacillus sp. AK128]